MAREKLLGQQRHAVHVKQRAMGVKQHRLRVLAAPALALDVAVAGVLDMALLYWILWRSINSVILNLFVTKLNVIWLFFL